MPGANWTLPPSWENRRGSCVEYYFLRYGDIELQRRMVSDRVRTEAFARAIAEAVQPGDVVLDVGTGTGILAMLAARAGARKVYGIEAAEIAQTAANLVKANGLQNRVTIFRGPAQDHRLAEKADLLISEWLGHFAFVENMLDDVLAARDLNLAPGGRMLPMDVEILLAPVDDPYLYFRDGPGFWRKPVEGLDLSSLEPLELRQGRAAQFRLDPSALLSPGASLVCLDLVSADPEDPFGRSDLVFEVGRDGVLYGFVGWFRSRLSETVRLDTGPSFPETHWSQTWFPFPPRPVREGEVLEVHTDMIRDPTERRHVSLEIRLGDDAQRYVIE